MFLGSMIRRAAGLALMIAALCFAAFGDTIRLKDGSLIKGRIVSFEGGQFTVEIGEGSRRREMKFDAADVESIRFDAPMPQASVRTETPVPVVLPAKKQSPAVVISDRTTQQPVSRPAAASSIKPVELKVKVLADETSNGWTNTGWVVKKGQKIRIAGSGEISIGGGRMVSPSGSYEVDDPNKLLKNVPTGALLAVIGDDNNDFIYIGADREFIAERDGPLFLGINEGDLSDNSGELDVTVSITPGG